MFEIVDRQMPESFSLGAFGSGELKIDWGGGGGGGGGGVRLLFLSQTLLQLCQLDYLQPLYFWKVQVLLHLKEIGHAFCK